MGIISSTLGTIDDLVINPKPFYSDPPSEIWQATMPLMLIPVMSSAVQNNQKVLLENIGGNLGILAGSSLLSKTQVGKTISDTFGVTLNKTVNLYLITNTVLGTTFLIRLLVGKSTPYDDTINGLSDDVTKSTGSPFLGKVFGWITHGVVKVFGVPKSEAEKHDEKSKQDAESQGYLNVERVRDALWAMNEIKHGVSSNWSTPEYKVYTNLGKSKGTGYKKYIVPAGTWTPIPSNTTVNEKYDFITALLDEVNFSKANNLLEKFQKEDADKRFGGKLPPNPRDGIIRSEWISEFVDQFQTGYPIDIGTGQITVVYDDRYSPYRRYEVRLSAVSNRLPPRGLPIKTYLHMANLLADGKQDQYMKMVTSEESKQ